MLRWAQMSGRRNVLLDPLDRMSVGEMSTGEMSKHGMSLQKNFPRGFICAELNTLWKLLSVLPNVSL